jgi:deoxyribonuclease V
MTPVNPEFVPDPDASRSEKEAQQRRLAGEAIFADEGCPSPDSVDCNQTPDLDNHESVSTDDPIIVGIDQAFEDDTAVSAAVAIQNGQVLEVVCGRTPLSIPYIPGLLAFREGEPIIDALAQLTVDPDLLVFDGSGRIHYRQAGIATHIGVLYDVPAIGITKNLLCGTPAESLEEPLAEGTQVAIRADEEVDAEAGTLLGYALQTRQFPNPAVRHVNPVFVSPGHRVAPETTATFVGTLGTGYKLPAPVRLADRAATECKR